MYPDKESSILEFKEIVKSNFLKTVSAFANYRDGEILFGIADSGDVIGIDNIDQKKLDVENTINDNITPRPKFTLKTKIIDDKEIIILKVFKGKMPPYIYQNKAYQRADTATVPVDGTAFSQLILEGSNSSFDELEANVTGLKFLKLETELKNLLGISELTDDILRTMSLRTNGSYTNAGMLLADENEYKFGIDIVRFGKTDNIFIERVEVKGVSLLFQYEKAMDIFDKWYSPYEEVVGFYRVSRVQIPREAFREALANALIHREYLLKANIRIAMREDGIEIISPGGLPTGITKNAYATGQYSQIRNEIIAETFSRLQLIEKYGTGVKRIIEAYQPFKQAPVFDVIDGQAIKVYLPKVTYLDSKEEFNDYEYRILGYINEKIETTASEILADNGGDPEHLEQILTKFHHENKLIKNEQEPETTYVSVI